MTVSIPVWFDWEEILLILVSVSEVRFNSSMVRLGVQENRLPNFLSVVSIPVWFDWEYHLLQYLTFDVYSFNSSMVRLGASAAILNV